MVGWLDARRDEAGALDFLYYGWIGRLVLLYEACTYTIVAVI